jgi:hypothetical protein
MAPVLPPTYDADAVARVLERVAGGESITAACKAEGLPRGTFRDWVDGDIEGLAARSARAVEAGCDALADQILAISDTPMIGEETTVKADGGVEVKKADMLGHRRLQIEARMRLLGKWSKRYADRQELHHTADESMAQAIIAARQRVG